MLGNLIVAVATVHTLLPFARQYTRLFYTPPYYQGEGRYLQGPDDVLFASGWLVFLTLARAALIEGVSLSIARYGHVSRKDRTRLAEQSWLLVYYALSFAVGMVRRHRIFSSLASIDTFLVHIYDFYLLA